MNKYHMMFQSKTNTLNVIQAGCLILALAGFPFIEFTLGNIVIAVLFFYVFSILGLSLTLHRYYSHKSFKFKNETLRQIFSHIALLAGRGSPLGWVYIHRLHHRYSDTEQDPHGPTSMGFRLLGFAPRDEEKDKVKVFMIKDMMTPEHLRWHNYYLLYILGFVIVLGLINFELLYFIWVLPVLGIQFSQNCFNYFAHKWGYRNHATKDDSTNNIWLWPFIWGDAWHNNHHNNLVKMTTKENWWEFDPVVPISSIIRK